MNKLVIIVNADNTIKRMTSDYIPKENETLFVDERYYIESIGKIKPIYDKTTDSIMESATKKEVEEYEKELFPSGISDSVVPSKTNTELEEELTLTQMAVAEGYEENLLLKEELKKTNALLDVASGSIVDIYETILLGGE